MSLILYGHPFSSYTQKVLVALYENGTPFEFRSFGPDMPEHTSEWLARWPIGKFPILIDGDRTVAETSIINEYLQLVWPGDLPLLPEAPMDALEIRFFDRFFDLHVMDAAQFAVDGAIQGAEQAKVGLARSVEKLERAYGWLEQQLPDRLWATGSRFTMADCAAAPSLFYADWVHQISEAYPLVRAYRARLIDRPSFARAIEEARPFRAYFPLGAPERD